MLRLAGLSVGTALLALCGLVAFSEAQTSSSHASRPPTATVRGMLLQGPANQPASATGLLLFRVVLPDDKDDSGKPIGFTLVLACEECPRSRSDNDGKFVFEAVPPGQYTIGPGSRYDNTSLRQTNMLQLNASMVVFKLSEGAEANLGSVLLKKEP